MTWNFNLMILMLFLSESGSSKKEVGAPGTVALHRATIPIVSLCVTHVLAANSNSPEA